MKSELTARHCLTHDGRPLAIVDGLPGGAAELQPADLRALAAALLQAASDCEVNAARRRPRRGPPAPLVTHYRLCRACGPATVSD